jgi:hypothetical protein
MTPASLCMPICQLFLVLLGGDVVHACLDTRCCVAESTTHHLGMVEAAVIDPALLPGMILVHALPATTPSTWCIPAWHAALAPCNVTRC